MDMTLRREVINLGRPYFVDKANEVRGIGHVAKMQKQTNIFFVMIPVKMVDTSRIK